MNIICHLGTEDAFSSSIGALASMKYKCDAFSVFVLSVYVTVCWGVFYEFSIFSIKNRLLLVPVLLGLKKSMLIFSFEINGTEERLQEAGKTKDLD